MTTVLTADYTLPAGQTLSAFDTSGFQVQGLAWTNILLSGQVVINTSTYASPVAGISAPGDSVARTVTLTSTGSISVDCGTLNLASGFNTGGLAREATRVVSDGSVEIRSAGDAWGGGIGTGGIVNHGTITVEATSSALGVVMTNGGSFFNAGTITATGGSTPFTGVVGLYISQIQAPVGAQPYDIVNTGTIEATQLGTRKSVGVEISGFTTLHNSGLIQGDYALWLDRDGIESGNGRMSDITNSGTLRGEVFLNNTAYEPVILHNSGLIDGAVTLNTGSDTYDGALGAVTGVVHGDDGADSIVGGVGAETLSGDAGADTIDGGGGADVLDGGDGLDVLSFASRSTPGLVDIGAKTTSDGGVFSNFEQYVVGQGDNTVLGSAAGDTITVVGGPGRSYIRGDDGSDLVSGGVGFDNVNGNKGDDTVDGGTGGNDWLLGGQGNDLIVAHSGLTILNGNIGADTVRGGDGADVVRGGQGDDSLHGGGGNDQLFGDRGDDTVTGGAGADVLHFGPGGGHDRIADFNGAEGDRIQLDGVSRYTATTVGSDTVLDLGNGDQLTVVDVWDTTALTNWIVQA